MANALAMGDKAPDFTLPDAFGKTVSLQDFRGSWVVLYFYPKDDTPGCTTEAKEFTAMAKHFDKRGAVVLGVSPDSAESHCRFMEAHRLKLKLLSDSQHEVLQAYQAWTLKKNYGREYLGVERSSFLIDPRGNIAFIWPKVRVAGHVDAVLEKLQELIKAE